MESQNGSPPTAAKLVICCGGLGLALNFANSFTFTELVTPALGRSSVLAGVMAVGLMLVGVIWTRANPTARDRVELAGKEGFELAKLLSTTCQGEIAWGSAMFLLATPAACLMLVWDGEVLMRRGILGEKAFLEGNILKRSRERQQQISLVNLELYPGAAEFNYFPELLPSILVTPIGERGWLLIGGWSVRCFSRSDERWAQGWADKLKIALQQPDAFLQPGPGGNAAEYEPSGPVQ